MKNNNSTETPVQCPNGTDLCTLAEEVTTLRATVTRLEQEAHTDSLTGLYNNRHFQQVLRQEIERTQRTGQPTTLILVDLDHFKKINDTWGHVAGDKVLQKIASIFTESLRKLDIPCRYGGEEFAILLPSTPILVAVQVAERLRFKIQDSTFMHGEQIIPVTASMGLDSFTEKHPPSPLDFVERVDHWLYHAKNSGRNCIRHGTILHREALSVSASEKEALHQPLDKK
ncbi:GGDEF domain-containing protein [Teredinibacter purpureus]|uniref:GGDEF domain-containing protein n=1 Tax=Teredinibacter purpureus TaxID=2731756 RepID=UPI0005F781F3|nr:GGDEF domain-containing protein [Teredinibacter purpureus]